MAVIKKDKIHGRIGNFIYRVVNVVEIIQAYPRSIKPSEGTKAENTLFGNSSQVSSKVYRLIKDFALNEVNENVEITIAEGEDIVKILISNNFKTLPITEDILLNEIPAYAKVIQEGYYKFGNMDSDPRSFKIAIYDVKAKKIIFYYQLM